MRRIGLLITILLLAVFALAQDYTPAKGEVVLKMVVEGRGNVFIRLYPARAPKTVAAIVKLVKSGFYNKQSFHKVMKSPRPYLVQIGDPASKVKQDDSVGDGGAGVKLPYEDSGLKNEAGSVGLAAIPGEKNSGDSQFYILLDRASFLDGKYTVFGQVVAGMDVVRRIERWDRVESATIIEN
ncbi:MAG: peptidylprolyl isomerase [Armatimonadetes bacterium]|jgi:cyclophilin family peptidyl-prolyl cis-trans isomerase|nr:peptidylprolyl isomerase [Armatimonadota bacterium]